MKNLTILLALVIISLIGTSAAIMSIVGLICLYNFVGWERNTYQNVATGSRSSIKRTYSYDYATN